MTLPVEVGRWLATHVQTDRWEPPRKTVSDGELLMWAGRAAQPIDRIELGDYLTIQFKDMGTIVIKDDGQSCCENRYLTCDDDLSSFHGARIVHIDLDAAAPENHTEPETSDFGDDCHEQLFLKVRTTNGDFTVCAHNEHNGYYGGFNAVVMWEDA